MNRQTSVIIALAALLTLSSICAAQNFNDPGFVSEQFVRGLSVPIGFTWAPDGRVFVWEKAGRVRIVKDGQLLTTPFLDIRDHVNSNTDRGLIGLALDPNFSSNGYVYLAYVYENQGNTQSADPRTQRVTRVRADPGNPDRALPEETVLIGKVTDPNCDWATDCIPNDKSVHTIDHLLFGPDGKLYASVGDGSSPSGEDQDRLRSQDLDSLNGKLLRINTDGTGPSDNPFFDGNPNSNRSKVYNYGLRNPYRFTFDSRDGRVYIGDVGSYYFEEIDRGKGQNFGWPCWEGTEKNPNEATRIELCKTQTSDAVTNPVYDYARASDAATIILGPVYNASSYPDTYKGNLFFLDFVGKWLKRLPINSDGSVGEAKYFATGLATTSSEGPVYVGVGPDGNLYYALIASGQIRRIKYTGGGNQAPQVKISATPTSGPSPLDVQFSSSGSSDPEGGTLTYAWDFGDGATSTDPNPTHRYTSDVVKKFTAKLTVKDPEGATASDSVVITVGSTAPSATIETPTPGTLATAGDVVEFRGSATDTEDGSLAPERLTWEVILRHNDHFHSVSTATGSGGSFTVEAHGESGDTYSYIVRLTAKDSSGLTDVKEVEVAVRGDSFVISIANGGALSATVQAGQTATYALQVSGPPTLNGAVNFACSGAPANSTCQVQPTQVTLVGGAPQNFTVSVVTTNGTVAGLRRSTPRLFAALTGVMALFWVPLAAHGGFRKRFWSSVLGVSAVLMLIAMISCGGDGDRDISRPQVRTPAGDYTLKVTATSGATATEVDLGLKVQ